VIGLDTIVLVRYFAQDDARQSAAARKLIDETLNRESPGFVNLVTLAETVWVLRRNFAARREELVEVVGGLLSSPNLQVERRAIVRRAVEAYGASGSDFADCLIRQLDDDAGCARTLTFDRKAVRLPGVELLSS
jgi:predicted nucleic-acid-binding protein